MKKQFKVAGIEENSGRLEVDSTAYRLVCCYKDVTVEKIDGMFTYRVTGTLVKNELIVDPITDPEELDKIIDDDIEEYRPFFFGKKHKRSKTGWITYKPSSSDKPKVWFTNELTLIE